MKKKRGRPTAVDLFSGVGGMSLGFEQAGFDVVAAYDFEERHTQTYRRNFPKTQACTVDLTTMGWRDLPRPRGLNNSRIDVVFGGSPCQGFSICGRRDCDDERNHLIYDFIRLVREIQPRYFVLENVDGLLKEHAEPVRISLERRIRYAGYRLVRPVCILNAADFGVPQRRQRVFFLGYRDGETPPEYPKSRQIRDEHGNYYSPTVHDAIGDLPKVEKYEYLLNSDQFVGRLGSPSHYARILRGEIRERSDRSLRRTKAKALTGCARTRHTKRTAARFRSTLPGKVESISHYHRLNMDSIAPAQRAGTNLDRGRHTAARPIHPLVPRCITAREAARLHSFPDWFQFHETRWHAFRQIGNSVPPRLARAVALKVRSCIE